MKPAAKTLDASSPQARLYALIGDGHLGPRKEQVLPALKQWLDGEKAELKAAFTKTGHTDALLLGHTQLIDMLIGALFTAYTGDTNAPVAVIPVGGYGRRELFPYSDIDLLFLHDGKDAKQAANIAEFILYMLWDLGLKVGQAHRSVSEAITLAKQDITIRTTLLDARFLVGRNAIFDKFQSRFSKDILSGTAEAFVEAKMTERDARHLRFGDSRYMLEPNVKEGKGGLRDLHTLWWLARYAYPIHTLKDLVAMHLLTEEEFEPFEQAGQFLCKVRVHLHYLADHAEERLTFDRQHALAVAMGFTHPSPNRAVERFMRRYFVAVRMVGAATRIICSLLEEQNKRKPHKSLSALWHNPWKLGAFVLEGERLMVRSETDFEENPLLMLEIFRIAQLNDLDVHPRALQLIARNLRAINRDVQNYPEAGSVFMEVMLNKKDAEPTLRKMSEAGVLGRFIQDFGRVVGQTQFNMYHVFTVDEHTLVAIGILHAIENGVYKKELPLASDLVHRIHMRKVLYLSLFCHDIAKGRGGDHSELGEKIAARLARRFGFTHHETETTAWLVKYHLLFSDTSSKRDLNDPKTIQTFVSMVQSTERLNLLYVLTVADIRAVSPTVWNAWKASLLDELYLRAKQTIGTGQVEFRQHESGLLRGDLQNLLPNWSESDIDAYLEQGNSAFLACCDPVHHAAIARMLKEAASAASPLMIDTKHDYGRHITEITVCTPDQNGLFSRLAGAMALAGANIISAKIFTLKNGMAVDIFQVQSGAGEIFDRPDKLAKMSVYIEQAISGRLDLGRAFEERKREFRRKRNHALSSPGQVFVENEASSMHTVIEMSGQDRTGFLYQVTHAIGELGLSIVTAHISTYGTEVADVFYVKDIFGMKVSHEAKLRQMQEALLNVVNNQDA